MLKNYVFADREMSLDCCPTKQAQLCFLHLLGFLISFFLPATTESKKNSPHADIRHEQKLSSVRVCKVVFEHLPKPLKATFF